MDPLHHRRRFDPPIPITALEQLIRRELHAFFATDRGYQSAPDREQFITEILDDIPSSELLATISDALATVIARTNHPHH